jgi:transposase
MVFDGPINRDAFLAYVEQFLAPILKPGDVVIMDNLPAHKLSDAHIFCGLRIVGFADSMWTDWIGRPS